MNDVAEATVQLKNRFGLHVRTASMVAKAALRFRSQIWISDEHQNANARSVVEMTSLGARQGRQLKLKAQGPDAKDAVKEIRLLFETSFGEK